MQASKRVIQHNTWAASKCQNTHTVGQNRHSEGGPKGCPKGTIVTHFWGSSGGSRAPVAASVLTPLWVFWHMADPFSIDLGPIRVSILGTKWALDVALLGSLFGHFGSILDPPLPPKRRGFRCLHELSKNQKHRSRLSNTPLLDQP